MHTNVGQTDRIVRIIIALALFSLVFFLDGSLRWFGLIGVIPLITGIAGRCPAYRLLGFSTCTMRKPD
ncbi:DUF2892 domain-containing protein [Herminiimonas sp. NPDC097707]|uniref:YgaP family membrane protein n=1 Tax=Herminiimonas sp. NPDC097707 TaxID=3364007 RepID=UPI00383B6627